MGRVSNAKTRLLQTAMELMYVRGYNAVGVQEICTHAGVKKGSFYHFFPSKRDLLLEVIDIYGHQVQAVWEEVMRSDDPPLERLQHLFEIACNFYGLGRDREQLYGCPLGNLALELSNQDAVIRQKLHETFSAWTATVERLLQEAILSSHLRSVDTAILAETLIAYFEGAMVLAKTQNDPAVVSRLAQRVVLFVEGAALE